MMRPFFVGLCSTLLLLAAAQQSDEEVPSSTSGSAGEGSSYYGSDGEATASVETASSSGLSAFSVLLIVLGILLMHFLVAWCVLPKNALAAPDIVIDNIVQRKGCLHWLHFLLIMTSFTFAIVVTRSCKFLLLGLEEDERKDRYGVGLYRLQDENRICAKYSDDYKEDQFDPYIQIARFFSVVTPTLTGLAMLLWITWHCFCPKARAVWTSIRLCLYLSFWSTGLTFFMFGFDECSADGFDCLLGSAAILLIVNLFVLGVLILLGLSGHLVAAQNSPATHTEPLENKA